MKKLTVIIAFLIAPTIGVAQVGHVMQGIGATNMSMGGAATGFTTDISGALQWNPASISTFNETQIRLDMGLFFSSPEVSSTVPVFDNMGAPTGAFVSGTTEDDRSPSVMPALGAVFGKADSKHTFGASAFGISGFGVLFPESTTNPITMPQANGGFGQIESNYMLLQLGVTYAYQINEMLSVGVEPTFSYASLELMPNPTANPSAAGYPSTNVASATGLGAQLGLYFDSGKGFTAGLAYKTPVQFSDFEFENTYIDNSTGTNNFAMDYPAIYSVGAGYSTEKVDIALDYRMIDYENTDGFSASGWTQTASVAGFGWKNISVISAGVQLKMIEMIPIRIGYTFSENPIESYVAFFNVPATAIIKYAYQIGAGYALSEQLTLDAVFHYGISDGETSGPMNNPMFMGAYPPYGAVPGSEISYDMTTSMIMFGVTYSLN